MRSLMAKSLFFPSVALNIVLERLSLFSWYTRIDEHVVLGAIPFRGEFSDQMRKELNVSAVVSMNENYELKLLSQTKDEWASRGVRFLQLPVVDIFDSPPVDMMAEGVDFINGSVALSPDSSVYVHCKAGRTRSATLVACYLVEKYRLAPEEAVELIRSKRPYILLSSKQLQTIQQFHELRRPQETANPVSSTSTSRAGQQID